MPEPRLIPQSLHRERPRPQVIRPQSEEKFPLRPVAETQPESPEQEKDRHWKEQSNFALRQAESQRIEAGLRSLEQPSQRARLDGAIIMEASKVLDAYEKAYPGWSQPDLIAEIRRNMRNNLGADVAEMSASGVETPTPEQSALIIDYMHTRAKMEQVLAGLETLGQGTDEAVMIDQKALTAASRFISQIKTQDVAFAKARANEILRQKRTALQKAGITVAPS